MPTNNFQKIQFEAVQSPDGQSMCMDLSLPKYLARVTIGSLGTSAEYCDTEIINTETEETTHWQHQEFGSAVELNAALTDFFLRLRDLPDTEVSALDQHLRLNTLRKPLLAVAAQT